MTMTITATDFKTKLGKYLEIVSSEDIFITKNGKVIAQLSKPQTNKISALRSLVGIAESESEASFDDIREERLKRQ